MILELMVWCETREQFVEGMTAYGFATVDKDGKLTPIPDVAIDEIGPITKKPATYDEKGVELTPAEVIDGWHVNIRVGGKFAEQVTQGLPQFDEEGTLNSIFTRTHLLYMIPNLVFEPIGENKVPAGYKGPHGVKLYDPALVNTPSRVWA